MLSLLADAGTPLMWFGLVYPFVASFGVAVIEEQLLKWFWHVPTFLLGRWRPVLLGNLATTALGIILLNVAGVCAAPLLGSRPIERVGVFTTVLWSVAFILTVAVEAPFFGWVLGRKWTSKRTWVASLLCNGVTYALLCSIALVLGVNSVGHSVKVVDASAIPASISGWVYFVPAEGTTVERIRFDGSRRETTSFRIRSAEGVAVETLDLKTARLVAFEGSEARVLAARLGAGGQAALSTFRKAPDWGVPDHWNRDDQYYMPVPDFTHGPGCDPALARFRAVNWGWPDQGAVFTDLARNQSFNVAAGMPFLSWSWRDLTVLPDGRVIGALGSQIVVVDIPSKSIAWLANGRSPAVLLDKPAWVTR